MTFNHIQNDLTSYYNTIHNSTLPPEQYAMLSCFIQTFIDISYITNSIIAYHVKCNLTITR